MRFKPKPRPEPLIEIAPLIDVVFLLLLFFMVTTQFVTLPGIKLTLPGVSPGSTATATARIEVQLTESGDAFINGEPVSEDGLGQAVAAEAADLESAVVVIKADRAVRHGRIMGLMDQVRRQGLKRVVLAARFEAEEGKEKK